PMSPMIWVAYGPITTEVRSMTRTPVKGPDIVSSIFHRKHAVRNNRGREEGFIPALRAPRLQPIVGAGINPSSLPLLLSTLPKRLSSSRHGRCRTPLYLLAEGNGF